MSAWNLSGKKNREDDSDYAVAFFFLWYCPRGAITKDESGPINLLEVIF